MTTLITSNNEMEDIIKKVKSLEVSGLLLKRVTETVQNEEKEENGALGASLLGNPLTVKGIYRAGKGKAINRRGEWVLRAGYVNKMDF